MTEINQSAPVGITGATGYVAGWIVKKLLQEGFTVHAPVRDPGNAEKLKHLNKLAETSPGEIRYFEADLLEEGSYDESLQGCELVFHTASPFSLNVKDPQKDLVDPALLGTRNVLNAAGKTNSVKRVVLTSSCAAIYGDNIDLQNTPDGVFTEDDWNTTSSLDHQPYSYSKTVAEREAWHLAEEQSQWDLVVVNPSMVIGPGINPNATSESFSLMKQLGDGTLRFGSPDYPMGAVDIRDLAEAHYAAGFTPAAQGRHIISGHNTGMLEFAELLREEFGSEYPIPTRKIPKALVWLLAPFSGLTRKVVSLNVGHEWKAENSKSRESLGVQYRPLKESICDFFRQMIANGAFA